jgi:lipopolysaccharide export system permease protein
VHTLWRYLGTRFLSAFLGSAVILALTVLVVDMLLNLDDILETQETLAGAAEFLLVRAASIYLPYLIPAATFTGAFISIGLAARSREILAVKAGGIAPLRALVPVFVLACILTLLALALGETLTVRANAALSRQAGSDFGDISLRSGTIWYHTGRFVYNIRDPSSDDESVRDIRVYQRDDAGRLVRVIVAESATRLEPGRWHFRNATKRDFDPSRRDAPPQVERAREMELVLAEDRSPRLLQAELAGLPVWTLASYVRSVLKDGGDPGRARQALHERLTTPLLVIVFALLAVPLGLAVEQTRSLALPALQGVILLFLLLSLREYGAALAPALALPPVAAPWVVVVLFSSYGVWRLARTPR